MNKNIMYSSGYIPIILGLLLTLFAVIVLALFFLSRKKKQNVQIDFLQSFVLNYKPSLGMEKNLDYILLKTQELHEAASYSFYIYNPVNQRFTLKAVRQLTADANIAPSYSGLLPYEKEKFEPPLSLSMESVNVNTTVSKDGEVPLLTVPIQGGQGVIRIGPVSRVPGKTIKKFEQFSRLLEVPLRNLMEEEEQQKNYKLLETSSNALKHINRLFMHETEYIKLLVQTCMKSTNPVACLIIENQRIAHSFGMEKQEFKKNIIEELKRVMEDKSFTILQDSSAGYSRLRQFLSIPREGYFVIFQFPLVGREYLILFAFSAGEGAIESTRSQSMKLLWSQIQNFIGIKHKSKQDSISYIQFLKGIADLIDQMSPFTTGASKLMANYSMAIAKEMGLSEYQIQSIGLAAYLSNIGIIGLSDGLLNKNGVYSDKEYDQMKLHSEVGAAIIENTTARDDAAQYVKHHHERIDGNGYPSRLKGDQIPVGSRIIGVVQTFLAKINGRSYRDPLPFEDALKLIQNSAGSQLDPIVVAVFLRWYEKRRNLFRGKHMAIGNCWDLCCVPASICSQCSVFGKTVKNCWEYEKNSCLAHGKTCETCFVYTESITRAGQKMETVM